MIDEESAETLTSDVAAIFSQCAHDRRPALELVLRYLLGEFDRDGIFQLLKSTRESHSSSLSPDHFDSSDEDEDGDDIDTRGLELSDGALKTPNTTFNVPLPRTSGVLWANDGHLVYFLHEKEDKPTSILNHFEFPDTQKALIGPSKAFTSFGRLSVIFGGRHPLGSGTNATDDTSSDDGEESSSSGGSDIMQFSGSQIISSLPWSNEVGSHQRSKERSVGDSHRSSSGPRLSQVHRTLFSNTVSIVDVQDILPQSRQLGQQYILSTNLSQCCQQNSNNAESLGYHDIADSWLLLEMISQDQEYGRATSVSKENIPVLEIQSVSGHIKRTGRPKVYPPLGSLGEKTSWGCHPFGTQWLLKSMFSHFDHLADVQTLAVMLCAISKANRGPRFSLEPESKLPQRYINDVDENEITISSLNNPSPLRRMQSSKWHATTYAPQREFEALKGLTPYLHSAGSSWVEKSRNLSFPQDTGGLASASFQETRDPHRAHRSNSALVGDFAGSLPRQGSPATSASTSPVYQALNGTSPSGSFAHVHSSLIAKRAPNLLGKLSVTTEGSSHALSPMPFETHRIVTPKERPKFQYHLKNQERFFGKGHNRDQHLIPFDPEQRKAIIYHYAELLEVWGLVEARIVLLKQFFSSEDEAAPRPIVDSIEPLTFGKSGITVDVISQAVGPQLALNCNECSCTIALKPGGKCLSCSSKPAPLACQLCHSIVSGLSIPCLSCGHLLHLECRRLLVSSTLEGARNKERQQSALGCVAGCNCPCPFESNIEIQPLFCEQRQTSEGIAIVDGEITAELSLDVDQENVLSQRNPDGLAYESLARNLGKKRLASRSSQIGRGRNGDGSLRRESASSNLQTGSYNS